MDILEGWRLARVLPLIRGRLLDLGCGYNNLVTTYGNGVGADTFPWPAIDVRIGSSTQLPFANESFDTATIIAALNHIPERPAVMREIHRILSPEGRIIVTMIGPWTGIIAHLLFPHDETTRGGHHPEETKGMTWTEVRELLIGAGFNIRQESSFQLGLNHIFVATKVPS
jgi:SAM-dependent methyltransferase